METRKCLIIISRQKAFTFSSIGLQMNGTRTKVDCFHSLGNDFAQIFMRLWALNNTNLETLQQIRGKGVHFRLMCVSEKRLKTRANLVPRFLSYSPAERKRSLGTRLYKHAITIDRFHMTSRRPYLCTKR